MSTVIKLKGAAECGPVPSENLGRIFLRLSERWALGHDPLQWILMTAKLRRGQCEWQPVAFVATEKRILRRVMHENGVQPSSEGLEYIDAMHDTFRAWCQRHKRRVASVPGKVAA